MVAITGHRGARGILPENTLAGFAYARDLGCARVELDVQLTKDNRLAVIHDADLERTTNGTGAVADYTFEELQAFDAGNGQRIPSLEEVFELLRDSNLKIQVELKGIGTEAVAPKVVEQCDYANRVVFTSFFHKRVRLAKEQLPDAEAGILIACNPIDPEALLRTAGADALHVNYARIDDQLVRTVHDLGRKIVAWGVIVEIPVIERVLDLGVDVIGSDRPDLVLQCLRDRGSHG